MRHQLPWLSFTLSRNAMKRITTCSILFTALVSPGCGLVGTQVREVPRALVGTENHGAASTETSADGAARVTPPQVETSGVEAVNFIVDQSGNDPARSHLVAPAAVVDLGVELTTTSGRLAEDGTGIGSRQSPGIVAAARPTIAAASSYTLAEIEQIALSRNPALAAAN